MFIKNCHHPIADKPDAPQNLKVTEVSRDYVVLTWEAPENDGGAKITRYTIEKKDATKFHWGITDTTDGSTYTCKVTKLYEGTEYLFRVAAENKIGQGEFTELADPVIARLPFGK